MCTAPERPALRVAWKRRSDEANARKKTHAVPTTANTSRKTKWPDPRGSYRDDEMAGVRFRLGREEKNGSGLDGCRNLRTGMLSSRRAPPPTPPLLANPPLLEDEGDADAEEDDPIGIRTAWNQLETPIPPLMLLRARWYDRATFSATAPDGELLLEPKKTGEWTRGGVLAGELWNEGRGE